MKVIDYHEAIFASELSTNAKITALVISSYYNWSKNQMCWPSNATLSKGTGLSVRSISRATKELQNAGYLEVWRRTNNSNMYRPLVSSSSHSGRQVLTHSLINNEYNNEINNEKDNQTLFDNYIQDIDTEDVIDLSSETIETGPALITANAAAARIIREDWLSW